MAAQWTFLLADLRTNKTIAELPLTNVSMTKVLCDTGSMSGDLLCTAIAKDPYILTTPGRTVLYALRDDSPWWGGIVWTRRYDSSSGVVSLGAADWWSYYDHRKIIPVLGATPFSDVPSLSVDYLDTEQNEIARQLVALAHSHTGGNIGVAVTTNSTGIYIEQSYWGYELVDTGEALRKLSKLNNGPDMMFDVGGPDPTTGQPLRLLRLGSPHLGQQGSPHVFEHGGNAVSYTWPSDASRMATRAWAVGNGMEVATLIDAAEDTGRYTDGWPLLEKETSYSSQEDPDLLEGLAIADQAAARLPVALPTVRVTGDKDPRIGDYSPGDDAKFVIPAGDPFMRTGRESIMRIIQIAISPGDDVETATLTMSPLVEDAF